MFLLAAWTASEWSILVCAIIGAIFHGIGYLRHQALKDRVGKVERRVSVRKSKASKVPSPAAPAAAPAAPPAAAAPAPVPEAPQPNQGN